MRKREDLTGFGARLRQIREERNISQNDMIKMVNLYFGFNRLKTVQAFNRYEIYNAQPDVDLLICFARVLGTTVDYLVGNEVTPQQNILYEYISMLQKLGYSCVDKGNGFIEFICDDKDERYEAVFNYADFISFVNRVDAQAREEYRFEFIGTFFDELYSYAVKNYNLVTYTPKNKNANEMSADWIRFNEVKKIMQETDKLLKSAKDGEK